MPIVLSYTDVEALGSLAKQSGYDRGFVQGQQARHAREDRRDLLGQQQEIAKSQAEDRWAATRYTEYKKDQRFQAELDDDDRKRQQDVDDQMFDLQGDFAMEGFKQRGERERDVGLEANRRERIRLEASLGKYKRKGDEVPTLEAGGMPTAEYAKDELERFRHLAPSTKAVGTPTRAAKQQHKSNAGLLQITGLPTDQLEAIRRAKPDHPLADFMEAVIQDRRARHGAASPMNAETDVGAAFLGEGRGLGSGPGTAPDPILGGMTLQQIYDFADQAVRNAPRQ